MCNDRPACRRRSDHKLTQFVTDITKTTYLAGNRGPLILENEYHRWPECMD